MEIRNLLPRKGTKTLRLGNSNDLIVMESIGTIPSGDICLENHGIVVICTKGRAQFEYDGTLIQMQQNDLFLYMSHSVARNFMASSDFNCRMIFFTRSELWNINLNSKTSLDDMSAFKLYPMVHLSESENALMMDYFTLLCQRMRQCSASLKADIVHSLVCTMFLEIIAIMRLNIKHEISSESRQNRTSVLHKRRLVDKFMTILEQSDGRIRKVDDFATMLNVTPKYLSSVMKEVMNRRPSVLIHLFTMKAIEQRLRFTDMTMQEIARDLNFPNASFFSKYFKEHAHMTPKEYMLKYQKGK